MPCGLGRARGLARSGDPIAGYRPPGKAAASQQRFWERADARRRPADIGVPTSLKKGAVFTPRKEQDLVCVNAHEKVF